MKFTPPPPISDIVPNFLVFFFQVMPLLIMFLFQVSPSSPTKVVSTVSLTPREKVSSLVIICEAGTPGLNSSIRDVDVVEIHCRLINNNYKDKSYNSDAPDTRIILGGSLNQENIQEKSDVYFECLYGRF